MPEDPAVTALQLELRPVRVHSPAAPPVAPTDVEMWEDGRVVVYTDGSGEDVQDARFSRAGIGGYWGPGCARHGHARNFSEPLTGQSQTNLLSSTQCPALNI